MSQIKIYSLLPEEAMAGLNIKFPNLETLHVDCCNQAEEAYTNLFLSLNLAAPKLKTLSLIGFNMAALDSTPTPPNTVRFPVLEFCDLRCFNLTIERVLALLSRTVGQHLQQLRLYDRFNTDFNNWMHLPNFQDGILGTYPRIKIVVGDPFIWGEWL